MLITVIIPVILDQTPIFFPHSPGQKCTSGDPTWPDQSQKLHMQVKVTE